jgi:hypothetical protein
MGMNQESGKDMSSPMEQITLENETGANIAFLGRLYAEHSFYDEDSRVLTQQKLYVTEQGDQAYSVISSDGRTKEKRAYLIKREGVLCRINNGLFDVTVNARDLLAVVKGLCGLTDNLSAEDFLTKVQDKDRAANE